MDTPVLSDGISDDEAKIVLLLGSTNKYKPESIPVLLDGTSVFMEERTINLPLFRPSDAIHSQVS